MNPINHSAYTIREMKATDWDDVSRIYQQGMDTNLATFHTNCPTYEEWDQSHLKICRLVILEKEKIIGWVALSPTSSRCVYAGVAEVSIYIDLKYSKKGVGTKLLNETIKISEENGIWTLQSSIIQINKASIKLHEKCGFKIVGVREKIARNRFGEWGNTVLMEKRSQSERYL